MGAPKKKWSEEEEAALNAGIERYGAGKWSAILNDPDYQTVLSARTNVDLKDKWRNIKVMRNGVGHRQRGFGVPKLKSQNKNQAATSGAIVTKPAKIQNKDSVPSTSGLALVMKPPEDLNNDMQIDPQYSDMEIVQVEKHGTSTALVKYEVDVEQQPKMLEEAVEVVKHGSTAKAAAVKHEIDYFVNMTAEEAAIAAEEAVAEAEAAIERAERAVREAEAAEQEAEAARMFAQGKIDASRRHVLSALSRGVSCSTEICNNQKH